MRKLSLALAPVILAAAAAPLPSFAQGGDSCRNCGVVQSVERVQRTTQPRGIAGSPVTPGMAIGGVVGGLVGNQIGRGAGNTAATVAGAAGGAYLGHSIEKKNYTAYVMRVRMHDGTIRTIEQPTAIAKGSRVIVEGNVAHLRSRPSQG
jgi:uncharacterized protein YcfJ